MKTKKGGPAEPGPEILELLPNCPGSYVLLFHSRKQRPLRIGKYGCLDLRPGFYTYVGSAMGPGGLRGRLRHHLRRAAPQRWHIDYLKSATQLAAVWLIPGTTRQEHRIAALLQKNPEASIPLPGFGASDCDCGAHLFYWEHQPDLRRFQEYLRRGTQVEAVQGIGLESPESNVEGRKSKVCKCKVKIEVRIKG